MEKPAPHVVVVGGGFGGLSVVRGLRRAPVRVTLVDRRNHHLFQPLLYQVATAALNPSDIASPIRGILRKQRNATVLLSEVRAILPAQKQVVLEDGTLDYDYLVVATGVTHSYFGHEEWAEHAPGLKTLGDALEMRRRILLAFEEAEKTDDPAVRKALLTFVIVGGGPTGVELAGALGEIAHQSFAQDFRRIDSSDARILLVEAGPRILPSYPESLSSKAVASLARLGAEVHTGRAVTALDAQGVTLSDGERIASRTVLWAAGVVASGLARSLGSPLDRAGRVLVAPDLSVPGHPEIFVVGDLAAMTSGSGQVRAGQVRAEQVPGVAPAALQEGAHVAKGLRAMVAGGHTRSFQYWDKGNLATIGRGTAIADFGRMRLSGLLAWIAWLFIHIFFLIGFRNRFIVLFQWAWSYLTFQRGARLIVGGTQTQRAESQPVESQPGESQPGESQPGESPSGESQPLASRQGESPPKGDVVASGTPPG